jgi:hypothetical protein
VATVTDGVVTAVAAGTATITVTTTDGAKTATCAVTVAAPAASTYTVTLKEGTEDATSWTIAPAEATTTGVAAGTEVKATYGGMKKVKSVKAKKKAAPAKTLAEATAEDLGKIVGADGKIYATKAAAEAVASGNAVAMIAYVGSETGDDTYKNGLAIALADESNSNWNTAKSTCEGKSAVTNAAWQLPSQNQWKAMFSANGGNEGQYTGLNTAITTAGGTALQGTPPYWSSTPSGYDDGTAYNVLLGGGGAEWYRDFYEETRYRVRACLAF